MINMIEHTTATYTHTKKKVNKCLIRTTFGHKDKSKEHNRVLNIYSFITTEIPESIKLWFKIGLNS